MLVLTRRTGETVMIGDEIAVTILGGRGSQIQIGIRAPRGIAVHRAEVYERIRQEQEQQEQCAAAGEGILG